MRLYLPRPRGVTEYIHECSYPGALYKCCSDSKTYWEIKLIGGKIVYWGRCAEHPIEGGKEVSFEEVTLAEI